MRSISLSAAPTATLGARVLRPFDWTVWFASALAVILAALVLLPMYWLVLTSFRDDASQLTIDNYRQLFSDPSFLKPLLTTIWTSTAVGVACVAIGAPMSWLMARTDLPYKGLLRALMLASFATPPFLGAFAWVLLGGPNAGMINKWYYGVFHLKAFAATPLINIFSAGGMVFVMSLYTLPYVFTFILNSLEVIPSDLEDASAILGTPAWKTLLSITLPLCAPAILASFIIAFLQSMTLFGTPAILALPAGVETMTTKIWSLFQYPPQLGLAAALSLPMLMITIVLLKVQGLAMGRRGYAVIGGKGGAVRMRRLGPWKAPALILFAVVLGCSIGLPYFALLRTAFVENWSAPFSVDNLSLVHWHFVFFEFSQTKLALTNTFLLGSSAATVGTILVTLVAYFSLRKAIWGHQYLAFLATAPVAVPGIVLAVGLFLCYTHPPLVLYGTLFIIFLAYLTKELPVGFQQMTASLRSIHPELEDAGRIFGANRVHTMLRITVPLAKTGVIATWIFIFIGCIRELSATILLFTARTKTIAVTMFDLRESNDWGPIAVLSITMLAITLFMLAIITRFTRGDAK